MPNIRIMLWLALAAILYLNYEAWVRDYPDIAAAAGAAATPSTAPALGESVPQAAVPATPAAAGAADLQQSIPVPQAAASAVPSAPQTDSRAHQQQATVSTEQQAQPAHSPLMPLRFPA